MFLLGRHAILGQEPPIYLRSTTATRLPSPANVHAARVEPLPPPSITRANSSGCASLRRRADGDAPPVCMRPSIANPQPHARVAAIGAARRPAFARLPV